MMPSDGSTTGCSMPSPSRRKPPLVGAARATGAGRGGVGRSTGVRCGRSGGGAIGRGTLSTTGATVDSLAESSWRMRATIFMCFQSIRCTSHVSRGNVKDTAPLSYPSPGPAGGGLQAQGSCRHRRGVRGEEVAAGRARSGASPSHADPPQADAALCAVGSEPAHRAGERRAKRARLPAAHATRQRP